MITGINIDYTGQDIIIPLGFKAIDNEFKVVPFVFDTGAQDLLFYDYELELLGYTRNGDNFQGLETVGYITAAGVWGERRGVKVKFPEFKFLNESYRDVKLPVALTTEEERQANNMYKTVHNLLGLSILSDFRYTVDVLAGEVILQNYTEEEKKLLRRKVEDLLLGNKLKLF